MKFTQAGVSLIGLLVLLGQSTPCLHAQAAAITPALFSSAVEGNVFAQTTGEMTLKIDPAFHLQSGEILLKDETGKLLNKIELDNSRTEIQVPLPGKGFYALEADVASTDGKTAKTATTAAVIGLPLPEDLRLKSKIGIWTVFGDPHLAEIAGSGWNRQMTTLGSTPLTALTAPDQYAAQLHPPDYPVAFNNVGVFSFGFPSWLLGPVPPGNPDKNVAANNFRTPKDWSRLNALVRAFVRHPNIPGGKFPPYLEIYNEPEWAWQGSDADLVKTLGAIADAVKQERPDVKVLGPGFSAIRLKKSDRLGFEDVDHLGLFKHLDGVVVHAYVDGSPPEADFIQHVQDLKKYLAQTGRSKLPIYITEFGWTSESGTWQRPVDELTQAQYAARSLTLLSANGITAATYFCLLYKGAPNAGERSFSLLNDDQTPKPGYAAFANVAHWLAGVEGEGNELHLTPNEYLILFQKAGQTIGVAWTTQGTATFTPFDGTTQIQDVMGREIDFKKPVTLSPSPVFMALSGQLSDEINLLPPLQVMCGGSEKIAGSPYAWIVPDGLTVADGVVSVPDGAPEGKYLLLAKTDAKWVGQPIEAIPPFRVLDSGLEWPAQSPAPDFKINLSSSADSKITLRGSLKLDHLGAKFFDGIDLNPKSQTSPSIPLPDLAVGQRNRGPLEIVATVAGRRFRVERPVDLTFVPCLKTHGPIDWNKIGSLDFSQWDPFGPPMPADQSSAAMQSAYDERGLHFRVSVHDQGHIQTKTGSMIFQQDSIQLGFDADAGKPWNANEFQGLKGHRVFEYGIAWNGKPGGEMTWRWISYSPGLPVGTSEPRIQVHAQRIDHVTQYDITVPWKVLAMESMPAAGSSLGISVAVSDVDPKRQTRGGDSGFSVA